MIRALRDATPVDLSKIATAIPSKEYSFPSNFIFGDGVNDGVIDASIKNMKGGKIHLKAEIASKAAISGSGELSFTVKHKKSASSSYTTYAVYGPFTASDLTAELGDVLVFDTELPRTMYPNFKVEASGTAFTSGKLNMIVEA